LIPVPNHAPNGRKGYMPVEHATLKGVLEGLWNDPYREAGALLNGVGKFAVKKNTELTADSRQIFAALERGDWQSWQGALEGAGEVAKGFGNFYYHTHKTSEVCQSSGVSFLKTSEVCVISNVFGKEN